jgi:hypothetical protein
MNYSEMDNTNFTSHSDYHERRQERNALRAAFHIEGVPIEDLVEEVTRALEPVARRRDLSFRAEVIAWDSLVVAADGNGLRHALCELAAYVLAVTDEPPVTLSIFPSHDESRVVFEIRNARPARRKTDVVASVGGVAELGRQYIEAMGGEITLFCTLEGGTRINFWLPQWI